MESTVLDVLMPNGIFVQVEGRSTFRQVKARAWELAQHLPLYGMLKHDRSVYNFVYVSTQTARREEVLDDDQPVRDVCSNLVKLVEAEGDRAAKLLNAQIGLLIGKSLADFDALRNPEVHDFRWRMRLLSEKIARQRKTLSLEERIAYLYPPRLESQLQLPSYLSQRMRKDGRILVNLRFECERVSLKLIVLHSIKISELLKLAIEELIKSAGPPKSSAQDYILKVTGREEYLFGPYILSQFKYVRDKIAAVSHPRFTVCLLQTIQLESEEIYSNIVFCKPADKHHEDVAEIKRKATQISSWVINKPFSFNVNYSQKLKCNENSRFLIIAGLYLAGEPLCSNQSTQDQGTVNGECQWNEELNFDIEICSIPKLTRLCFALCEIDKQFAKNLRSKRISLQQTNGITPIAWVNTTLYDYKEILKIGSFTLHMWSYSPDISNENILNPFGTVFGNPHFCQASTLTLTFKSYHPNVPITYPSYMEIKKAAREYKNIEQPQASKMHLEELKQIYEKEPLQPLYEQEKELLWFLRYNCMKNFPDILPKLLKSVKWHDNNDLAQMMILLETWPPISPTKALELLGCAYPNTGVRNFAVKCLESLSDEELSLYLLQLVQAIKHEVFFYSNLVKFLLKRALNNRYIGHQVFWLLRAEMDDPCSTVRFGLILEAYCRGALEHIRELTKQVEAVNSMKKASDYIKSECPRRRISRDKLTADILNPRFMRDKISDFLNPLDPSLRLSALKVEKCRFMDSKMKPLWLVLANSDEYGDDVYIIFKNGDDLRQDMLTLQMIRIMDKLWKDAGYDFRMTPYHCVTTDVKTGLIEVVLDACTIANIQKGKGSTVTSAFTKGKLLAWLREHNPEPALDRCIEEFTLSCAGYCVATFVMGIADRHSDNIMVKTNGQLFHIDFGHILGHFKEKFGIRRERVPFVLTHDFVYVITQGLSASTKSTAFKKFEGYCEKAYMILRQSGALLVSLLAMMLSTGMPELASERDLEHLRDALALDRSEAEARRHFQTKFQEALRNSWQTSLNWSAHNFAKDNR